MPKILLQGFELEEVVGSGAMGTVWRGRHRELGTPVAVKVLSSPSLRTARYQRIFNAEVRAVAALNHPAIVRVHDFGWIEASLAEQTDGRLAQGSPWLAMEWVDHEHLPSRCGRMSWHQLRSVLRCVLRGLAHCHARGMVHRDLKPANILFEPGRPAARITDFGLAQALDVVAMDEDRSAIVGTPNYGSPEQLRGRWRDYGPWTDLYGLGCTAYAMACGHAPFSGGSFAEILTAHFEAPPPPVEPVCPVPDGFGSWIHRLMQKDPAERYTRAADALTAFEALGEPPLDAFQLEELEQTMIDLSPPTDIDEKPTEVVIPDHPESWRDQSEANLPLPLPGVGLEMFGVREIPLIGREAERDHLWTQLARVRKEGRARAVVIRGASGYGKTRLARWLCEHAHEVGAAEVLRGRHSPVQGRHDGLEGMLVSWLRLEGLSGGEAERRIEQQLRRRGAERPVEWRSLAALVTEPDSTSTLSLDVLRPSERHAAFIRAVIRAAHERPVIVFLDDVHNSRDTVQWAKRLLLVQKTTPTPALLVLTARDESLADHAYVGESLRDLEERDDVTCLSIGPLSPAARAEFVREQLSLDGAVAGQIELRTGGNPEFALQLVRDWVRRGILVPSGRGFVVKKGERLELPADVERVWSDVLDLMLDERDGNDEVALEIAAALGHVVDTREWTSACTEAGIALSGELLDLLFARRLATPVPAREHLWRFVHGMVVETLNRRSQADGRWVAINRVCARAVSASKHSDNPERVGRHLVAAELHAAALRPLLQAARRRISVGSFGAAESLLATYHTALEASELPDDDPMRGEGHAWNIRLASLSGRFDLLEQELDRLEPLAVRAGWKRLGAFCALHRGVTQWRLHSDPAAAHTSLRAAIRRGKRLDDKELLGRAYGFAASVGAARGDYARAAQTCHKAEELLSAAGFDDRAAECVLLRADIALQQGDADTAQQLCDEAKAAFEGVGSRWGLALCATQAGDIARRRDRLEDAVPLYRDAIRRLGRLGLGTAAPRTRLAFVQVLQGDVDAATETVARALAGVEREDLRVFGLAVRLSCLAATDDWEQIRADLEHCARVLSASKRVHEDLARAFEEAGNDAEAFGHVDIAERCRSLAESQRRHLPEPPSL